MHKDLVFYIQYHIENIQCIQWYGIMNQYMYRQLTHMFMKASTDKEGDLVHLFGSFYYELFKLASP